MTRKDYIIIADIVVYTIKSNMVQEGMIDFYIQKVSDHLSSTCGNFNPDMFRKYILKKL